jgi:RimJ/RimL family protein N-acetyltransferase
MSPAATLQDLGHGRALLRYDAALDPSDRAGLDEAAETVRPVVDTAFTDPEVRVLVWAAPRGDWSSRRVAWRLGFTVDGTVRSGIAADGALRDAWVGTLLPGDAHAPRHPWLEAPVLEGPGVRLRPFTGQDVPRIVEGSADPTTQYWLGQLPTPYTAADAHAYLEANLERQATNAGVTWAMADPGQDDLLLGTMGLFRLVPSREVEVGYWTHPDARGRGLTARATSLAIGHAFSALGVRRVTAYASAGNVASQRILERCGMRQIGVHRLGARLGDGTDVDLVGYDLVASEFPVRSANAAAASTTNPASDSATPTTSGDR